MKRIRFHAPPDAMGGTITNVPAFPGESFGTGFPECIGPTDTPTWFDRIRCSWQEQDEGRWLGRGGAEGVHEYSVHVEPHDDFIDFAFTLTNRSDRAWKQTFAFNCFQVTDAPSVRDHDGRRHWVRRDGAFRRLIEVPRVFGPRPTIQLYSVEGAPPSAQIPFVAAFQATPEGVALEGWMAIQSRDGERLVATVSSPPLFLFHNREYSCIHSAPAFGSIEPGGSGRALTRLYFVDASLEQWHARMTRDMKNL